MVNPLIDWLYIHLYRFIIAPLLITGFSVLALFGHRKAREGLKMRLPHGTDHPWRDLPKRTQPIWIHCASGEFEYAKPVISLFKKIHPQIPVLVTYFSPSFRQQVQKFPGVNMSCPLPWDFPGPLSTFIHHHQPRALLIARTDLWPEVLYQTHKQQIPTLLFSATKSKITKFDHLLRPYKQWLYSKLNVIFSVSNSDRLNFLDLGADLVHTKGDTRYDQVFTRLENPKPLNDILFFDNTNIPTLICGSTWPEDEKEILLAANDLVKRGKLKLIIAPHEPSPSHLQILEEMIFNEGLNTIYYSKTEQWPQNHILIIDRIGILAELYQKASLAFVGGSFRKTVHSVMEPLAAGCPTLVGPFHHNNREALEFSQVELEAYPLLNAVNVVKDHMAFYDILLRALERPSFLEKSREEIKNLVKTKKGASQNVVEWIEKFL